MTRAEQSEIIRQAKVLRGKPPSPAEELVLLMPCQFKINQRCRQHSTYILYDPTGELFSPLPVCGACHDWMHALWRKDEDSAEAQARIWHAAALTQQAQMRRPLPPITG